MSWRAIAILSALLGSGCLQLNPDHCGNKTGDAFCKSRGDDLPYCSLCVAANDGCVAEPVVEASCHKDSDSGAPSTSEPATSEAVSTSTGTSTSDPTTGTTTTGTSTTTTGTTTTGTSTTVTTDMSSGTGSSTTTQAPVCGDDVAEDGENCDGTDLGGKSCADFGYGGGALKCTDTCDFDILGCCKSVGQACQSNADCCEQLHCNLIFVFKCEA